MRYVVKFKARAAQGWLYAPDGEKYECDRDTSLARFETLLQCGRRCVPVYGLFVTHVRIEDLDVPEAPSHAVGLDIVPMANVVLSQYVDDDEAVGPWASERAAA